MAKLNLFNFIDILFTDPNSLEKPEIKSQFTDSFMLTRRLAIRYPQQANFIQSLSISDPKQVLELWKAFVISEMNRGSINRSRKPYWLYTKGPKNISKSKTSDYSDSDLNELCDFYKYSIREVKECTKFEATRILLDEKLKEIKSLKKLIDRPDKMTKK